MMEETSCRSQDVRRAVLSLALPSMLAMLASGAGVFLDALLLARAGAQAAPAAGCAFPLTALIQTIGFTFGMGAGSAVSRLKGRGDGETAGRCSACALLLALALGAVYCAAGLALHAPLLRLLAAPQEALGEAAAYTRCVLLSAPAVCFSLVVSSLLRGVGQTLPNLAAYGAGSAAGAGLSVWLVLFMGRGAAGAGIALLVRETLTALILLAYGLRALPRGRRRPRALLRLFPCCAPRLSILREIMRSGLPTLLRQGAMTAATLLLTRACAAFGASVIAGMGLALRLLALIASGVIGFGQGFQPVCGIHLGAGQEEPVRKAYRFCMRCVVIALSLLGAALFPLAGPLLSRLAADAQAAAFAASVLRAQALVLPAQGAVVMMTMLTQAAGLPVRATLVSASRQGYVLIPLALLLPRFFGQAGLVLCQSAADLVSLPLCWLLTHGLLQHMPVQTGSMPRARIAVDEQGGSGVQ